MVKVRHRAHRSGLRGPRGVSMSLCQRLSMQISWTCRVRLIRLCQVGVRNQPNLYPRIPTTDIAKLLQYSGSRVEHEDGFSS